ncbi:MAG TPA: hypothetical protein VHZ09_19120 [Acidobacteriaceae bacterium]|jgi:hypothetical protein|nr:hypothetical protein [Acidobacteriaceae bacterium]
MQGLRFFLLSALILLPGTSIAGESFDGSWLTKMTCPPKGNTEGYSWQFTSVIQNSVLHGERGTAGDPGYFALDGRIAENGSAKLNGGGIVMSRQYAKSILAHEGANYSYDVKAKFEGTQGTGTTNTGLGIEGRPCTFEFTKQQPSGDATTPQ